MHISGRGMSGQIVPFPRSQPPSALDEQLALLDPEAFSSPQRTLEDPAKVLKVSPFLASTLTKNSCFLVWQISAKIDESSAKIT